MGELKGRLRYLSVFAAIAVIAICVGIFDPGRTFAQTSTSGSSENEHKFDITGTVINEVTSEPLSRALVLIYGSERHATFSDAAGHFEFTGLSGSGFWSLEVRKPGFFNPAQSGRVTFSTTQVGPGNGAPGASPSPTPISLMLTPEAQVHGHVEDENGEPLEGVGVQLTEITVVAGRQVRRQHWANTNDDGEFRFSDLTPGSYYISTRTFRASTLDVSEPSYPALYYPHARERSAATPIRLAAGQHLETALSLKPEPTVSVSGTLTGLPANVGAYIRFFSPSGDEVTTATIGRGGTFEAHVPSGLYTIKASSRDGEGNSLSGEVSIDAKNDLTGVHFSLSPGAVIPVHIRLQQTQSPSSSSPSSHTDEAAVAPQNLIRFEFHTADESYPTFPRTQPGKDGSFFVRDLEPGKYRVEVVSNSGSWYVQSANSGVTDLLREELTVGSGSSQAIEVVLGDDASRLGGTVNLDDTNAHAEVVAISDRDPSHAKNSPVFLQGRFSFWGLPPGPYKLFAFDRIDGLEYTNPEVMREYAGKAVSITLQPHDNANVKLDLIRRNE